ARGSRLAARGSRLAARGSRLAARGSRLAARGSRPWWLAHLKPVCNLSGSFWRAVGRVNWHVNSYTVSKSL
ncbi:hypothetical protein ABZ584_30845, partial [Streptomyces antibioticus]|uniref:hypothetical protein n=1 Tax=Streptomyces antibioticus TaxID=1890 RepID=UPI0033C73643